MMKESTKTKWLFGLSAAAVVLYITAIIAFWGVVVWGIINVVDAVNG